MVCVEYYMYPLKMDRMHGDMDLHVERSEINLRSGFRIQ